jgi:hypothetical protein
MERLGTGSALSFSPVSIEGIYRISSFYSGHPECSRDMIGEAEVIIIEGPTAEITGLATDETICEGDPVTIILEITGGEPFELIIAETSPTVNRFFNLTNADLVHIGGFTYHLSLNEPPIWEEQGDPIPGLSKFKYSIVNYSDTSGCPSIFNGESTVRVFKTPETGPQYHIPNTFEY